MSSMTPRERMLAVLNHKRPDRTPFHFKLSPALFEQFKERTGTDNVPDYFGFNMRNVAQKPTIKTTDFSKTPSSFLSWDLIEIPLLKISVEVS